MALQKITYEDKTALLAQPAIANINKISDTDMNEIKTVVNAICDATDSNTMNISGINTKITNLENKTTTKAIIDVVYPVGSIYISKDSTNPGTLWPGTTWAREAEGRCIIGIGTGYTTVGATGGSSTVTLDTTQIPSHTHTFTGKAMGNHNHGASFSNGWADTQGYHYHGANLGYGSANRVALWSVVNSGDRFRLDLGSSTGASGYPITNLSGDGNHNHNVSGTVTVNNGSAGTPSGTNSSTGGGGSHNNMQPYIVMYIWRRTA